MKQASRPVQLGRYRIIAELGRGNMGVVYKAEDSLLDRTVAVKTIILSSDPEERTEYEARFRQEAKAAGGFNHPNLITIYDVGREGDVAYMAMELLDGTELRDLMKRGALPLPQTLDIIAQVAEGLGFVHQRGVVHRDVKPGNVMVTQDGRAKIMDFGIARMRVSEIQTQAGAILGSPKYMSPEQVTCQRIDHRSDIFSLGVVLYEAATGTAPFFAKDVSALMHQIATANQRAPTAVNAGLPPILDFIVSRALEKDPGARYQNARDLAADLRACLASLTAQTPGEATVRIAPDATTTVRLDAAAVAAAAREAAAAPVYTTTLRAGDLATHLSLSRRFDSDGAYRRLTGMSTANAGRLAAPPRSTRRGASRWLRSLENRAVAAAVAAALIAAIAIAIA